MARTSWLPVVMLAAGAGLLVAAEHASSARTSPIRSGGTLVVTKAAPWAAWGQPTNQFFFSDRVDQRSFLYQPVYETPPYNVLALK